MVILNETILKNCSLYYFWHILKTSWKNQSSLLTDREGRSEEGTDKWMDGQTNRQTNASDYIAFTTGGGNNSLVMIGQISDYPTWSPGEPLTHLPLDKMATILADSIFKCIFLNENVWIPIRISLKFVSKGPINNIPALVQIMAWCHPGTKPLSEPMMVNLMMPIRVTRPQWVNMLKSLCWSHLVAMVTLCYNTLHANQADRLTHSGLEISYTINDHDHNWFR